MQIETKYSYLVWDKDELPIDEKLKPLIENIDFSDFHWNAMGLPKIGSKYSVVQNQLYFEESPNGKMRVEKQDQFTGDVYFGNFFLNNNKSEPSYFVAFLATFLKGNLVEVKNKEFKCYDTEVYEQKLEVYKKRLDRFSKIVNSWWYRWLYKPYLICVRGLAIVLCWILLLLKEFITRIALFLTPF